MTYSKQGLALTESFEGCKLCAYQDSVGRWTVGYGHTAGVQSTDCVTQDQAEAYLVADVAWAVAFVNHVVYYPVNQGEFDALVDFCFNLGSGSLQHSTLLQLINKGDFADAANEFEKWSHAGGVIVAGLLRRRLAEKTEFQS